MNPSIQEFFATIKGYGLSRIVLAIRRSYPAPLQPAFDATVDEIAEAWGNASAQGLKDQLSDTVDPESLDTFACIQSIGQQAANLLLAAHPELDRNKVTQDMTVVAASVAAHYDGKLHTVIDDYIAAHSKEH